MKIMKKNQVVILVIALMLVTAGYLNFTQNPSEENMLQTATRDDDSIGDATLVSSNAIVSNSNEVDGIKIEEPATEETATNSENDYFSNTRMQRNTMFSQTIDSYQKMLNSESIGAEQKAVAQNEITKINETQNAIMITENLIKTKGFSDVVILANGNSINVIVLAKELKQEDVAQIQNIVSREMKAEIENIHISNK